MDSAKKILPTKAGNDLSIPKKQQRVKNKKSREQRAESKGFGLGGLFSSLYYSRLFAQFADNFFQRAVSKEQRAKVLVWGDFFYPLYYSR
jgi:hypothetical protein